MWLLKLSVFAFVIVVVRCVPVVESNVELVHVFFRHGDRTPIQKDFYPLDPYKNLSFYPTGLGQLTNNGKNREYNLGQMLRRRYNEFLGETYTPEAISASSTDFARTKMSLMLVLAGLWPPSLSQQWNPALAWQPIPFDFKPASQDHIIQRPKYCPRYVQALERVISSETVQNYIRENIRLFEYVEKWTGKPMTKPINIFDLYQNLKAEDSLNLTLPEWTRKVYPEPLHTIAGTQLKFENSKDILIRLNGGRCIKMILENTRKIIKHDKEFHGRKMVLISGHENNVVNVLAAVDLFSAHVPNYGSAVLFELHRVRDTEEYAFKVLYHDQISSEPKLLKLKDCDELCPLERFVALTSRYVPGNMTAECQLDLNLE